MPRGSSEMSIRLLHDIEVQEGHVRVIISIPEAPPNAHVRTWMVNIMQISLGPSTIQRRSQAMAYVVVFPHVHSATCNHRPRSKGAVWRAADEGDVPGLEAALQRGESSEEAAEVSCFVGELFR